MNFPSFSTDRRRSDSRSPVRKLEKSSLSGSADLTATPNESSDASVDKRKWSSIERLFKSPASEKDRFKWWGSTERIFRGDKSNGSANDSDANKEIPKKKSSSLLTKLARGRRSSSPIPPSGKEKKKPFFILSRSKWRWDKYAVV